MAHGVEARAPFLDDDPVNFSFSLPAHMKTRRGSTKHIHREAMRGIAPDALIDQPDKLGFTVDQFNTFNSTLAKECLEVIEGGPLQKMNLVDFTKSRNWISRAPRTQALRSIFTALQATLFIEHGEALRLRTIESKRISLAEIQIA